MYEKHYGLRAKPFRLSPDPAFFFTSATHKSAMAYMRYGLYQGEGFVIVTGGAGTGKTTLIRTLLNELSRRETVVGEIMTTQLQPDDLLRVVAASFHLDPLGAKSEVLGRLQSFLSGRACAGQQVLLVIDEAQNLPQTSFEELRMLSNLQQGTRALLQCILLGQPPLRDLLARAQMEQLQQRVIAAHHLHPLGLRETRGYILHRLCQAGWCGDPEFSGDAIALIYRYSQGIPRRINSLCDRLLLFGALENLHYFDAAAALESCSEWAEETGQGPGAEPLISGGAEESAVDGLSKEHVRTLPPVTLVTRAETAAAAAAHVDQDTDTFASVETPRGASTLTEVARQKSYAHLKPYVGVAAGLVAISLVFFLWPEQREVEHGGEPLAASEPPVENTAASHVAQINAAVAAVPVPVSTPHFDVRVPPSAPHSQAVFAQPPAPTPDHGEAPRLETQPVSAQESLQNGRPQEKPALKTSPAASPLKTKQPSPLPNSVRAEQIVSSAVSAHMLQAGAEAEGTAGSKQDEADHTAASHSNTKMQTVLAGEAQVPADAPAAAFSQEELAQVLSRFRNAYETGDTGELAQLFAPDARSDKARNREAIARTYQKLFNVTDTRHIALKDVRWQEAGAAMKGEGQFGVTVRERGRGMESSYTGRISLRVERRDGHVVITRLEHNYTE